MTHFKPPFDPEVDEAASLWAARLDGSDLSNETRLELTTWLAGAPQRRKLLTEYCQFSTDLEEKLPQLLSIGEVELPAATLPATQPVRWWPRILAGGLAAAAAVVAIISLIPPEQQFESLATPAAQRQSLNLVDGSSVDLDARTSLSIDITDSHRRLRLAEGQAFFAVTKDPERPFIIETPSGSVRVRGTQFDVQATQPDSLTVTVIEGVVQVRPTSMENDTAPVLLNAGDQLLFNTDGVVVRKLSEADLENTIAWRQGYVVFQGAPLSKALNRFARHHGIGISASPEAAQQRIGGRFSLDDLDGFFTALEEVVPVRVSRNLNGTVQVNLRETHSSRGSGE